MTEVLYVKWVTTRQRMQLPHTRFGHMLPCILKPLLNERLSVDLFDWL